MQAVFRAVESHRPLAGLIHPTDCGSRYCAHAYQNLVLAVFTQRFYLNRIAAKPVGVHGFRPTSLALMP
ncbi:hypothetical protein CI15_32025 [Paraburkholderia monticola]|uniref:Integrase catalytic domain-containing protein n=1 Tax=Paraburkholderia monticola TaxID=1399968 RepID=A0A149PAZ2_9BURK|nr:hypothetical protein CI15_32025 [Paraburkholderia monticola]